MSFLNGTVDQPLRQFIGDQCFESVFLNFNLETACISLLISKLLGVLVILGSVLYKVPQIITIWRKSSVVGLSSLMFIIEIYTQVITLGYNIRENNPFSTYGEYVFMIAQNVVILLFFFVYSKTDIVFSLSSIIFPVAFYFIVFDRNYVTMEHVAILQALNLPLFMFSRIPQIIKNFTQKGVGALSFTTTFLQLAGSGARLFTTYKELDDKLLLITSFIAVVLNGTLLLQILYYGSGNVQATTTSAAVSTTPTSTTTKKRKSAKIE
ncbi:hypothetical protein ABK040_012928 [Willaertia magna]